MKHHPQQGLLQQIFIGLIIMAVGVIYLFDNFGWWDAGAIFHYWPVLLIVLGVIKLQEDAPNKSYFTGAALIAVGAVLTMNRLGWLSFSWKIIWPLMFMLGGLALIVRAVTDNADKPGHTPDGVAAQGGNDGSYVRASVLMGGIERRLNTPDFKGGRISAVMGGCELDLRLCDLQGEATLDVQAVMGGVEIKVPMDWAVEMRGTPILGGFEDKTMAPQDSSKRLIITGVAVMGGVSVESRPR
ncbi:DUF5668 domain-containing protein [Massilia sp. W12]|uniref:LiaF transmembrane domain-containing protein n=1 Tax=Massilia sp. W12 TaxID=3126507 RepID=UPI0030D1C092